MVKNPRTAGQRFILTLATRSATHRRSRIDPDHDGNTSIGAAIRREPSCAIQASICFTSESVSEGHPDKVADRLSDTVLDAFLAADPYSRVACETLVTTNRVVLAGETRGPSRSRPNC